MKKREEKVRVEIEMPTYTSAELDEFGIWLDQFRNAKTVIDKKEVSHDINPIDMQEAAVSFGAMSKKMHKIHGKDVPIYSVILKIEGSRDGGKHYEHPTQYDFFNHKYDAWERRKFAISKQLEGYDEMAMQQPI
jgi:hypothetical protein